MLWEQHCWTQLVFFKMANFRYFWRHKLIFYHFIFKNEIYSKFHPYLIFLKRETTENKIFLPKILLRTKIFKSSLFQDTFYYKICDVTKIVIFNHVFVPKFSYIHANSGLQKLLYFYFMKGGVRIHLHPIPPDLRNTKCPGRHMVKLSISAALE